MVCLCVCLSVCACVYVVNLGTLPLAVDPRMQPLLGKLWSCLSPVYSSEDLSLVGFLLPPAQLTPPTPTNTAHTPPTPTNTAPTPPASTNTAPTPPARTNTAHTPPTPTSTSHTPPTPTNTAHTPPVHSRSTSHPPMSTLPPTCLSCLSSGVFMTMACVGDFVIDILLGCAHAEVRTAAAGLLYRLCQRGPMSPSQVTINGEQLPVKKSGHQHP